MTAAAHPFQSERLAALREYRVLDTEAETDFDDIVDLASEICETPISLVSLVDKDRQWFKARKGIATSETPLESSVCAHAILEDDYLEIGDTIVDPRTAKNPLNFDDPGMRFYAGAVLRTDAGMPLGTLCVLDREPRTLSEFQRKALQTLAKQVMTQLDLRRAIQTQEMLKLEVDHRVRNSLQGVTAMIALERNRSSSPEVKGILDTVSRRLDMTASLHQELYQTGAGHLIKLQNFVPRIAELLQKSAPEDVAIKAVIDPVVVTSIQASALGVIINEFATNAFKHAFSDIDQGVIIISGKNEDDGSYSLQCRDNGVGVNAPEKALLGGGLGLRMVEMSARQLRGDLQVLALDDGFGISITFDPQT